MSSTAMEFLSRHLPDEPIPLNDGAWFVLLEVSLQESALEAGLHQAAEEGLVRDAVIAKNGAERDGF